MKKDYPKITIFDHNPEAMRVESATQLGSQAINVTSFAEIKNLDGVMHYGYRAYTMLIDPDNQTGDFRLNKSRTAARAERPTIFDCRNEYRKFFDD